MADRGVIVGIAASTWAAAIGLVFVPIYVRYIGTESFGLAGFMLGLQAWLVVLDLGLGPTATRMFAQRRGGARSEKEVADQWKSMEWLYGGAALVLTLSTALAAPLLVQDWLHLQSLSPTDAIHAIAWLGWSISFQWVGTLYRSALVGQGRQAALGGLTMVSSTVRAVGTWLSLASLEPTLHVFVICQTVAFGLETLALRSMLQKELPKPPGRFSLVSLRPVWPYALALTGINLLAAALNHIDKILLGGLLPLAEFGHVVMAMAVVGGLSVAVAPVYNAAFADLASIPHHNARPAAAQYHAHAQTIALTVLPAAATLHLLAPTALFAWTGDRSLASAVAPIASIWILGTAMNGLGHVPYALQLAHGWTRLALLMNAMAVPLMVPALVWVVPRYGAIGAGWIWFGVNFAFLLIGTMLMHRRLMPGEWARWAWSDTTRPLLICTLVALAGRIPQEAILQTGRGTALAWIAFVFIMATLASAMSVQIGRRSFALLWNWLRTARRQH